MAYHDYLERRNAEDATPTQADFYRRVNGAERGAPVRAEERAHPERGVVAVVPLGLSERAEGRPAYAGARIGDVTEDEGRARFTPVDIAYRRIVRAPTGEMIDMLA